MSDVRPLLGDDDLVTGEAVALDLPPASVGLRVASGSIDVVFELFLLVAVYLVATVVSIGADDALYAVATLVSTVLVLVAFPTAIETMTRGRSLGKLALGLRTVRDDAGPIAFRHSFVRALIGVVEIWIFTGVPALVCALVTTPRQTGRRRGRPAPTWCASGSRSPACDRCSMPPHLAGWARSADIAPLPDGLALAVRQFLDRAASLNAASRATLGGRLAEQVLTHVAPAPPPGQHPEAVLAAVLAERRRRDEARLARDEALRARLRQRRR